MPRDALFRGDRLLPIMGDNYSVSQALDPHFESSAAGVESQNTDLPVYTLAPAESLNRRTTSERVEHAISLDDGHRGTCCTLKVRSRAPNSKSLPIFIEGEPVTGTIELGLQKPDLIKAIVISFKGLIVDSGYDSKTFLNLSQTMWQSSMGDPRAPSPTAEPFTEKLTGNYSWTFSFALPSELQLSEKEASDIGLSMNERLPPSLADRGWHSFINYQITLDIKRGGFFQTDSELTTLVGYCPATRPDPPSQLRTLAYEKNTLIMGPDVDPEGWKVFPEICMKGKLFKAVEVSLSVSLALATPLAYTRGTAFPCALILTSNNEQAVDLLSAPKAPVVHVRRKLQSAIGESMRRCMQRMVSIRVRSWVSSAFRITWSLPSFLGSSTANMSSTYIRLRQRDSNLLAISGYSGQMLLSLPCFRTVHDREHIFRLGTMHLIRRSRLHIRYLNQTGSCDIYDQVLCTFCILNIP